VDGTLQTAWVVLDYFDVIVHVMKADVRDRYNLEGLWGDAPQVKPRRKAKAKEPAADA
jgi:ribosome-associated protein